MWSWSAMKFAVMTVLFLMCMMAFIKLQMDSGVSTMFARVMTDKCQWRNLKKVIEQRNKLSRMLNLKQQLIGQMECEKQNSTRRAIANDATSTSGGWCQRESTENGGRHLTDDNLAKYLQQFFAGKTVGSFGDGPGRYKQLLTDSGRLRLYDAFDGAPFCEQTSQGRVTFLDLTLPQFGLPVYDWVLSMEVAEHIPTEFESVYIDNIVRHAKEGVILSWAVPGQDGFQHINNRPFNYVIGLMDKLGFYHDSKASDEIKNRATFRWLRKNLNVYRRKGNVSEDEMTQES